MKKRIVVCCDGTWNRLGGPKPTNVTRLAQAMLPCGADGVVQLCVHIDGVGAGRGTGAFAQAIDRALGGAFGIGLSDRIAEAYRFLVLNYRPGDEIYCFGYSRGAYMARSLSGMIRNCGVLERQHAGRIAEAFELYRATDDDRRPDGAASHAFRARFAPQVTTSDRELDWRRTNGVPERKPAPVPLGVHYIGVWDTVGALGIPQGLSLANLVNRRHQFHDMDLSSTVHAARHAIAIDERRSTFPSTPWKNIGDFAATGRHLEAWFPGNHGSVGGGGDVTGLSAGALLWVLEGARDLGLAVDETMLEDWRAEADPCAPLDADGRARLSVAGLALGGRKVYRSGPAAYAGVAEPARARWRSDKSYRPKPLSQFGGDLDGE